MLATLAHQSWSRQLLLPCFFAKQIPTMLHEHFDDTLLFSRVEIFCSSTKRGQNLDCRLKIWSAKSGGGKRCDVTCVHRPGLWRPSIFCTQLNSRWLWHILRNKASAKSILTRLLEAGWGCLISALTSTILKRGSTTLRSMLPFSEIEYRQSGRRRRPLASEAAEADCHFRL